VLRELSKHFFNFSSRLQADWAGCRLDTSLQVLLDKPGSFQVIDCMRIGGIREALEACYLLCHLIYIICGELSDVNFRRVRLG